MKKLLVALMSLVLALSLAVPVMANSETNVTTGATVNAGGGLPPIIKCKWERPDDGDNGPGTQVLPSGEYQVDKPMEYFAVVTDPEGAGTVAAVYADVWHPEGLPECGSFKYQLQLHLIEKIPGPDGNVEELKAMVQCAYDDGLITFSPDYDIDEVIHEIDQCLADVYRGTQVMDYHQPAGMYRVEVIAFDNNNNQSVPLVNFFEYVPLTKVAFDFTNVDYGSVEVCTNKWVGGNTFFEMFDGYPTVRNLGNTNAQIVVAQDDMGLGDTSGVPNVEYDARLGPVGGNAHVTYDPTDLSNPVMTTIPGILELCNTQKLDFSIHVKKAPAGNYGGDMVIGCIPADWVGDCEPG
jgi:hypothetical protein